MQEMSMQAMSAEEFIAYVRYYQVDARPFTAFVQLVTQMRERQKAYFAKRLREDLFAAKQLEHAVDMAAAAWLRMQEQQDDSVRE